MRGPPGGGGERRRRETQAGREELRRVRGSGGRELLVRWFPVPPGRTCRGAAMLVHGIVSHSGWYRETGRRLAAAGIETAAPERRGSGRDRKDRGDAAGSQVLLEDLRAVRHQVRQTTGSWPVWIGISWGGKLAYVAARDEPERCAGVVLVSPGLVARVQMPWEVKLQVAGALLLGGRMRFGIPLRDPALFTANPAGQKQILEDPHALWRATARFFLASAHLDRRVAESQGVTVPVLLMLAGRDRIIDVEATHRFLVSRVARVLDVERFPGAGHTLELEPDPEPYWRALVGWVSDRFALPSPATR